MLKIVLLTLYDCGNSGAAAGCKRYSSPRTADSNNTTYRDNKAMRDRGIFCVQTQDRMERNKK